MTFGEKLQALRRSAGMSQDTLAERLDVSRQAVSKWERDEALPETENLIRIAEIFGVSLDELLQQPRRTAAEAPRFDSAYTDVKRTVRRHGYKLGYGLIILGALICVFSLVLRLAWPAIGRSFFHSMDSFTDSFMNPFGQTYLSFDGEEELSDAEKEAMEQELEQYLGVPATQQLDGMMSSALNAQANLLLIGLLPGGVLLIAGTVIVVKGKKAAQPAA